MPEQQLIYGIFRKEEKNRFICKVVVDSEEIECYVPSSCRLEKLIDLEGCQVALRPNKSQGARTRYALYAVKKGRNLILVDQTAPNRIVEDNMKSRLDSFLGKRNCIQRERIVSGYKSDLFLPETNTIVEIKSILSVESSATFPNVLPQRGLRQLSQFQYLLEKGVRVCYLLVSLNPRVKEIYVNNKYTSFYSEFQKCISAGMLCKGLSIAIVDETPVIHAMVPVNY